MDNFYNNSLDTWLELNLKSNSQGWRHLFAISCWIIWCCCNKEVIEGELISIHNQLRMIHYLWADCKEVLGEVDNQCVVQECRSVSWLNLMSKAVQLVILGTVVQEGSLGNIWVFGVGVSLAFQAHTPIMIVKLQGIKQGLQLAWDFSFKKILFRKILAESDSMEAVRLVISVVLDSHPYLSVILDIKVLMTHPWQCNIKHSPRKATSARKPQLREGQANMNTLSSGLALLEMQSRFCQQILWVSLIVASSLCFIFFVMPKK